MTDKQPWQSQHVYPYDDLRPHITDGGPCLCNPWIETIVREDGSTATLITHHAFDQRGDHRIWHYAN